MAKDAILDAGNERIPRRPLPYFDEQDDDVGLIGGTGRQDLMVGSWHMGVGTYNH